MKRIKLIVVTVLLTGLPVAFALAKSGSATQPASSAASQPAPSAASQPASSAASLPAPAAASQPADDAATQTEEKSFRQVSEAILAKLEKSKEEYSALQERIRQQKIPLSKKLSDLESELIRVRREYNQTTRLMNTRKLDLSNLKTKIESRKEEINYILNKVLGEYIRNLETQLHIAERQRYEEILEAAKLAPENKGLSQKQKLQAQTKMLTVSLDRLEELLGGTSYEGTAADDSGLVKEGTFVMVGPVAIFRSNDGKSVGTIQERLGSLEPAIINFASPDDTQAATDTIINSKGYIPFDVTLGDAHKVESTKQTLWQHIKQGGPVMVPILAMAGAALLVALYKFVGMLFLHKPSQKQLSELLEAVAGNDQQAALNKARAIKGPFGKMLSSGVEHLKEGRELMEEVMYETVLSTRLKLRRMLPFIAICAASAPLLGLLGTVTGIISTFKLITVFGSSDVKMLSGGISEALITTEFGLIVAIPSLLLHAFLSRKANSACNEMEKAAVALANQACKAQSKRKRNESNPRAEDSINNNTDVLYDQDNQPTDQKEGYQYEFANTPENQPQGDDTD